MTHTQTSEKKYGIQAVLIVAFGIILFVLGGLLYQNYTGKYIAGDNVKQCVFFTSIFGFATTMFILLVLHNIFPSSWFCKALGWHRKKNVVHTGHDGASYHGHCNLCNKDVLQDSNGDWF